MPSGFNNIFQFPGGIYFHILQILLANIQEREIESYETVEEIMDGVFVRGSDPKRDGMWERQQRR